MRTIFVTFSLLLSAQAFAGSPTTDIWVTPGCRPGDSGGSSPTTDITVVPPCSSNSAGHRNGGRINPAAKVFHFPRLMSLWNQGQTLSDQELIGQWRSIAIATTKECPMASMWVGTDVYEKTGLKNSDGSIFRLVFSQSPIGLEVRPIANIHDDAKKSAVAVNEARFSRPFSTEIPGDNRGKLDFACKTIESDKDKMICAWSMKLEAPGSANAQLRTCAADAYGAMQLYVREN